MTENRLSIRLALAALALGLAASAAPAARPAARKPAAPAVSGQIIALPLKQIIPAPQRLCTVRTASGLGYKALRTGAGPKPAGDATVSVHYIGYLAATGEVFDQAMDTSFGLKQVIPGFSEGLALMPAGSVYRICIPAALGYGEKVAGPIPANSDLVFQVELLPAPTVPARPK